MSAVELLQYMTQALFVLLAAAAVPKAVRTRRRVDADVALFFGAVALVVTESWILRAFGLKAPPLVAAAAGSLIMAMPYLFLRLLDDFRGVPRWTRVAAIAGLIAAAGALLMGPKPLPASVSLALVGYFAAVQGYATVAFLREALATRGITRRRMQAISTGSGCLALAVLLSGAQALNPGPLALGVLGVLGGLAGLGSGLAYFFGFSPPDWLRRLWREPELREFVRRTADLPAFGTLAAALHEVESGAAAALGAAGAAVGLRNGDRGGLVFRLSNGQVVEVPLEASLAAQAFRGERALLSGGRSSISLDPTLAGAFAARSGVAAPIVARGRAIGVLVVFDRRTSMFVDDDIVLVQLLAAQAATCLVNIQLIEDVKALNTDLERRVADRTAELSHANSELEAFSYSVSHDLRAPLRAIDGFSRRLLNGHAETFDVTAADHLRRIIGGSERMGRLIEGLLELGRVSRVDVRRDLVDLSAIARSVEVDLRREQPERLVDFVVADRVAARGDPGLLRTLLENLLGNAWKFTSKRPHARIEFGAIGEGGREGYFVRDDGDGFDPAYANKLFRPFQRLHATHDFEGTGIGLATVERIARRHGGTVWGTGALGQGATFCFTLGAAAGRSA